MLTYWFDILPHMLLAGGGLLIFCIGAFWRRERLSHVLFGCALIFVSLAIAITIFLEPQATRFTAMLEVGGYSRFFSSLVLAITGITLLFSYRYTTTRGLGGDEFYGLILFAALGMLLVVGSIHWLTFFLGLEVLSIALYVLIAIRKKARLGNEAAIKYLFMGAVASAFLVFGIAMVYAATGTMDIRASLGMSTQGSNLPLILLGFALILVGIGFKASFVPFHLWTPDVYQGAPSPVTAFLATGSKVAVFALLLRLALYSGGQVWARAAPVLWILAAATMVTGSITAITQSRVKRLLGYSSVAQMGYILMALLAVQQNGGLAVMFYLAAYALMDLGAFGTIATLSEERSDLDKLDDFRGLGYLYPWRSALLTASLLSLAGIPPTAGFIAKFAAFQAAIQGQFVILSVIGIVTVILSIYFYVRVIVSLYMRPRESTGGAACGLGLPGRVACGLTLFLTVCLGLFPTPLFDAIARALSFLLTP